MQAQSASKTDKKAARRRNRNKRRRKLRQQRKLKAHQQPTKKPATQKLKPKKSPEEISKSWQALCLETYQRLTTWQSEAELNFWKARAEWLQNENKDLKEKLEILHTSNVSNEKILKADALDDDEESDAAYLEFVAITRKHRQELKLHREKQSVEKGID